jgi:Outer membrane protein beta-barrel domain
MKNIIATYFLFVSVCFSAFSQIETPTASGKKMQVGLNAGTMFGVGGGGSMFSTYFQPTISYEFRPKWHFQTGLLLINQNFRTPTSEGQAQASNFNSAFLTAGLAYDVNEKLRVSGTVYSNFNQQAVSNFNNRNWGAMFGATYKISENVRISGSINISNGRNGGMWGTPWGTPMLRNSFATMDYGRW